MNDLSSLKQSLSMGLQDDLNKHLLPNEQVVVSLPGSFGEALVVTDKRVVLLRDCDTGLNTSCNVYDYIFAKIKGAEALSSATGGYVEIQLFEPVDDPDKARVFFPTYDLSRFQVAAQYISETVTAPPVPAAAVPAPAGVGVVVGAPVAPVGDNCPGCGFAVSENMIFCEQCGRQLRQRCQSCSRDSSLSARFCSHCGRAMEERPSGCAKCGAKVMPGESYCTQCGSSQTSNCLSCGASIAASHAHCWNCGRLIGSDRLDPRVAQSAQNRLREFQSRQEQAPASTPFAEPQPESVQQPQAASQNSSSAEDHNNRGREYFENDDVESAIQEFQTAVQLDPTNASYHYNLAVAYDEDEQDEQALAEYNEALRLNPNDVATLLSLGYMYNENDEIAKAQSIWNKILEIAPDSAEAQEVRDSLRYQKDL